MKMHIHVIEQYDEIHVRKNKDISPIHGWFLK